MKATTVSLAVMAIAAVGAAAVLASDRVAVYARIDRVVLEPDPDAPERIQVWGVFAIAQRNDALGLLGLRDGRLKYVYNLDSTRSQLFDLDIDPAETHDIAVEHSAAARWYAARLRSWTAAQQASVAQ